MSYDGVVRSFTVAGGRKIVSIKPEAMSIAKQAVKDAAAKKLETVKVQSAGAKRERND